MNPLDILIVLLLLAWIGGWLVFKVTAVFIHLLIIIALVLFIVRMMNAKKVR